MLLKRTSMNSERSRKLQHFSRLLWLLVGTSDRVSFSGGNASEFPMPPAAIRRTGIHGNASSLALQSLSSS